MYLAPLQYLKLRQVMEDVRRHILDVVVCQKPVNCNDEKLRLHFSKVQVNKARSSDYMA